MSDAAQQAIKDAIAKKEKQLRSLVQDRDLHRKMADNYDAAIELHQDELFDLLAALEKLGGSQD